MNNFKGFIPAFLIFTGFLQFCAVVFEWDSLMERRRIKFHVYLYGKSAIKFVYLLQAIAALVLGFTILGAAF